jgi:hypothetical protein
VRELDVIAVGAKDDVLRNGTGGTNVVLDVQYPDLIGGAPDVVKSLRRKANHVQADLGAVGNLEAYWSSELAAAGSSIFMPTVGAGVKNYVTSTNAQRARESRTASAIRRPRSSRSSASIRTLLRPEGPLMAKRRYGYQIRKDFATRVVPGGDPVAPESRVSDPLSSDTRLGGATSKERSVLPQLPNFRLKLDTVASRTFIWDSTPFAAEVWAGSITYPLPVPDDPFAEIVTAPLADGVNTFEVPKPAEGFVTFAQIEARASDLTAGDVWQIEVNAATVGLACRAHVIAVTPLDATVRVSVADPSPQGPNSASIGFVEHNTGAATLPASPQTCTPEKTLTDNPGTYVDFVVKRPPFGTGAGRVTFTATADSRTSDTDAVDVPEVDRDTQGLSIRVLRVSETAKQLVVRVEVISPNVAAVVTINYDNAGLAVAPAAGGTLNSTTAFGTTNHIDYTITRDAIGGTPRRVTFTASAPGFVDVTDGVDVPPEPSAFAAKVHNSVNQAIPNASGGTALTWDTEDYDSGALHDLVTNPSRFTIPAGGDKGVWMFEGQVAWADNGVGFRMALIFKNGTEVARVEGPGLATGFGHSTTQQVRFTDRAPAVGDYYEVFVNQNSGAALNVLTASSWFAATHVQA